MIGNSALEQFGQKLADHQLLFRTQREGIGSWQMTRQLRRHGFGRLAPRRKDQHRSEILRQGLGHESGPVSPDFTRQMVIELVGVNLFQRDWAQVMADEQSIAPETAE